MNRRDFLKTFGAATLSGPAVAGGAGTNYFQDKHGDWWCAFFGNDCQALWREKPGIVRIDFDKGGRIVVAKGQPDFVLRGTARRS